MILETAQAIGYSSIFLNMGLQLFTTWACIFIEMFLFLFFFVFYFFVEKKDNLTIKLNPKVRSYKSKDV